MGRLACNSSAATGVSLASFSLHVVCCSVGAATFVGLCWLLQRFMFPKGPRYCYGGYFPKS